MAIALRGTPTTGSATNGGNFTINMPAGVVQNDVVYVFVVGTAEANLGTSSAGWTQLTGAARDHSTATLRTNVFRKVMGASPDASIAITGVTGAANSNSGIAVAFSGVKTATPEDVTPVTADGTGNNPNPPAIVPVTNNAMILVFGGDSSGTGDATVTAPSNYTARGAVSAADNNDATAHGASRLLSGGAGASEDPATWTNWTATSWITWTIAIRDANENPPVTGTLAATDAVDTASMAGDVIVQGALAATDAADTASFAGDVFVQGSLSVTEGSVDIASFAGDVIVQGALAVSEAAPDTASLAGDVIVQGALSATDAVDSAAFEGTVTGGAPPEIFGTLAAVEGGLDIASFAGDVLISGSFALSEAVDVASFLGTALPPRELVRPDRPVSDEEILNWIRLQSASGSEAAVWRSKVRKYNRGMFFVSRSRYEKLQNDNFL